MKDNVELVDIGSRTSREGLNNYNREGINEKNSFKKDSEKMKIVNNKKKKPFKKWEKILILVSWLFFAACLVFYGIRFVKYYKIYNPKVEGQAADLLMNSIVKKSTIVYDGDGLYHISGTYVYKGSKVNNYIRYSNMLWRIVNFNTDGSVNLVLDKGITMLKWDDKAKKFTDSDIYKYLNDYFYKKIDNSDLTSSAVCSDEITDLKKITCNSRDTANVRLLSVSEFLNSKTDSSYINGGDIWLANIDGTSVWHVNGNNLSTSEPDNMLYVNPVITIKPTVTLISGTGAQDDPYIIQKDNKQLSVGSYVKMGDDELVVYDSDNDIYKLSFIKSLVTKAFSSSGNKYDPSVKGSLAYYLNTDFLKTLTYSDKLIETNWYDGSYDKFSDVTNSNVKAKVGLLNVADFKLADANNYYLLTPSTTNKEYLYSDTISDVKTTMKESVVPTIAINKLNISSGTGTLADPYILEVK